MSWFKKILGLEGDAEVRVDRYIDCVKSLSSIDERARELAAAFQMRKSMVDDIASLSVDEQKSRVDKFGEFMKEHKKEVQSLLKEKMKVEKSMDDIKSAPDVHDACVAVDKYFRNKALYKSGAVSSYVFDAMIRKAKGSPVQFSDVLVFDPEGKLLILHRRQEGKKGENERGEWCLPGGHVDPGECHKEAAERELLEETGLRVHVDEVPAMKYETADSDIHYFRCYLPEDMEVVVDSTEHDGVAWVDYHNGGLDEYDFIYDLKDNLKKILGVAPLASSSNQTIEVLAKALKAGVISPEMFSEAVEKAKNKTHFSKEERKDLADKGEAMPDGKYPIRNKQDLHDAIKLVGASTTPEAEVKAWIRKRAKELDLESELPESWDEEKKSMGVAQTEPLIPESLEGTPKKDIEKAVRGFAVEVRFDDMEDADVFKAFIDDLREAGRLRFTEVEMKDPIEVEVEEEQPGPGNELKEVFRDYLCFIEGLKTCAKNLHWSETDNSKHVYMDDLMKEINDFEDKIAEAGQSTFGRFGEGEIEGRPVEISDPASLVDILYIRTNALRLELDGKPEYRGEVSWIDDFLGNLKQARYRLQMN